MAELKENSKLGPYVIERSLPLGRGGMARVYIARLVQNGAGRSQSVALKIAIAASKNVPIDKAEVYADAIVNEVEILKGLKHPNIVKLHKIPWGTPKDPYVARAAGIDGEPWFFAMEYLAGGSLKQLLEHTVNLEVTEALEIADQIGLALNYAHTANVAHLDLKLDNILFREALHEGGRNVQAVLVDWGISARTQKFGLEAGTAPYMAPERIRERRGETVNESADRRPADVYALGILLYRMLTGRMPFEGRDASHLESAILNSTPTYPIELNSKIPPGVQDLILDALEKNPRSRLKVHDFNERIGELKRSHDDHQQLVIDPRNFKPARKASGGGRWWIPILGLLLLLFGGGALMTMNGGAIFTPAPVSTATLSPTLANAIVPTSNQTVAPTKTLPRASVTVTRPSGATATLIPSPTATLKPSSTPIPTNTRIPTRVNTRPPPTATLEPTAVTVADTPVPPPTEKPERPTAEPQPTDAPQPEPTQRPTQDSPPPPTPPP